MTISRKGKRRLEVDGRTYYWWAEWSTTPDAERDVFLFVVDEDGDLALKYPTANERYGYVLVIGHRFRDVPGCGGAPRRFMCPPFGDSCTVYPGAAAELIRWAESSRMDSVEVDATGAFLARYPGGL